MAKFVIIASLVIAVGSFAVFAFPAVTNEEHVPPSIENGVTNGTISSSSSSSLSSSSAVKSAVSRHHRVRSQQERRHHGDRKNSTAAATTTTTEASVVLPEARMAREDLAVKDVNGNPFGPLMDSVGRTFIPMIVDQVLPAIARTASNTLRNAGPMFADMLRESQQEASSSSPSSSQDSSQTQQQSQPQAQQGQQQTPGASGNFDLGALFSSFLGALDPEPHSQAQQGDAISTTRRPAPTTTLSPFAGFFRMFQPQQ